MEIVSIVAYGAMTFLAAFAFARLKRQEEDIKELNMLATRTLVLVLGEHIRASFEALNDMKETLHDLIDDERFEEAERLKATIAKAEHAAMRELERFKDSFGEDGVDIKMTSIRRD